MHPNWIMQRASLTPERIGLSFGTQQWTFQQLHEEASSIAQKINTLGLRRGERVALLAPSIPELIMVIYGCMHARLEMVMLNGRLSEQELAYQVEDADVKAIFVQDQELHKLQPDDRIIPFSKLQQVEVANVEIEQEWDEQDTITIMYTSGTTGFPKGVRQTVGNHSASAISSVLNLGLVERDTWLCIVPIFHISGFSILVRSLLYGMTIRLYEKFDVVSCAAEIIDGTVTKMSVVAVMLEHILSELERLQQKAHPNFNAILAGGGPIPVDYLQRAAKLHLPVSQTYGMTETSSQTATLANEDAFKKIGSSGKPLFFNRIKINKANEADREGEILVRGPHVTPGYIGRFKNKPSTENGWLHTGDIGYLDEDGYLYVVDRRSDLIISGGENVYPAEIENVLLAHPAVKEAGVCGIADEKWGQVPVAYIVLKENVDKECILDFCKTKLANYKIPKEIVFVAQLPRNGSNKLMRRKLKEIK
ncbi:o-succinylbenzoate--CoA ligase [Solibacillus sp. FSL H8-0538]|uniref:o-succinylbenzoate--CoA ligase n=1 Tax=Solibacillus sp. FSL H8-0538 TaxID=2921400 RepID=UPI0030F789E2